MRRKASKRNRQMTPGEVAVIFGVDPEIVDKEWAKDKQLPTTTNSSGDLRFFESSVRERDKLERENIEPRPPLE